MSVKNVNTNGKRRNKYMKRILAIMISLFIVLTSLSGCKSKDTNMRDSFTEFYSDTFEKNVFYTAANTEMSVASLYKENSSRNARVVLSLVLGASDKTRNLSYQWLQHSYDERKKDLRQCGNLVVDFAKNEGWKNDYYLFVKIIDIYDSCNIVYDYENDSIYIPNCEDTFIDMYQEFGTFSKENLSKTQVGKDFLIENGLATLKHNEIEYKSIFSYTVFIDNGEFKSYGEDDSFAK